MAITLTGREVPVAAGMLVLAGLGIAVSAIAREDCDTGLAACTAQEQAGLVSWHHVLHGVASVVALLAIVAAPIVLTRPLRGDPRSRALATYSVVTTLAGLVLLVGYVAAPAGWTGLAQRVFVTVPVAWTAVLGARLVHGSAPSVPPVQGRHTPASPA